MTYFNTCILTLSILLYTSTFQLQSSNQPYGTSTQFLYSIHNEIEMNEKILNGKISTITLNTWGLPLHLPGHDDIRRFNIIPDSVLQQGVDIVFLQETFHPKLRHNLLNTLSPHYYVHTNGNKNRSALGFLRMDTQGGLMTFSKYPIINQNFVTFPISINTSIIEYIGKKGFLVTTIQYGKDTLNLINTHLYSGHNPEAAAQRYRQIQIISDYIGNNMILQKYPIIFAGDINIHHPDTQNSNVYDIITDQMFFVDSKPKLEPCDYTMDPLHNDYVPSHEPQAKLDYIFYRNSNMMFLQVYESKRAFSNDIPISDHYGWYASFELNKKQLLAQVD